MNRFRRGLIAASVCLGLAVPSAQAGASDLAGLAVHGQTSERQAALLALYWLLTNRAPRPALDRPGGHEREPAPSRAVAAQDASAKPSTGPAARREDRQLAASAPDLERRALW